MKIYGDTQSGNCYKLTLACSLLKIEHEWVPVNILQGDTQQASFTAKNPNGKIPLLELDDGRTLSESNAILNYLAHGSALMPASQWDIAKVMQWQFFEQYSHEPFIAVARFISKYLGLPKDREQEYQAKQVGGHKALQVMEQQLAQSDFLVGNSLSCADISLYAYTHVAHEGGFSLERYPSIKRWINQIQELEGYVAMQ
jgi:glutathione S-transferase